MKKIIATLFFFPLLATAQKNRLMKSQLDTVFQPYFNEMEPGAAVLLVKNGKVVYQNAFGIADMQTNEKINSKTLFNLGSISKTVVAYGVLKLASENKLSLEDPISKYFPDFKSKQIAEKVKIVHLLTHTSGLPDSRRVNDENEFYLTAKDEENFAPLKQTEQLEFEPGTKYHYSNPAFNGLALIIEKVSGKKWQSYIEEEIFRPSKMFHSTITDGPHPETGVSHGYVKNKSNGFDEMDYGEEPTFAAAGNGGVWSNVVELWKYEKAIQQHLFLSKEWIDKSREVFPFPQWNDSIPSRLGLSWFLTNEAGENMIGHTGSQGGFISDYCWVPSHKIFYVLLCNTPKPIKEIRAKLFDLLKEKNWLNKQ
ncbi:MAG TPA: serine hydrolase domain-containing protein [Chitinophagaceae bacterium]|nr:serine hydrolase domain-containing protein [Chitinophagaceae bacterium]